MKEIDARGLVCPESVLQAKAAIEKINIDSLKVIVDNEAAMEDNIFSCLENFIFLFCFHMYN